MWEQRMQRESLRAAERARAEPVVVRPVPMDVEQPAEASTQQQGQPFASSAGPSSSEPRGGRPPPRGGGKGKARGRGSFVPDHVRNPHKYTCYVLDEPLIVGGGDAGAGESQRDLQQVWKPISVLF